MWTTSTNILYIKGCDLEQRWKNLFFLSVSNLTQIKQGPSSVLVCDMRTEPTVDPLFTYRGVLFSSCWTAFHC